MVNGKAEVAENGEHVGTRITSQELEKLDALVDAGMFLNRSDAVRTAVRELLGEVQLVEQRTLSLDQVKREILAHLQQAGRAYPSDIADALRLDYDLVLKALGELKKTGEARLA